jgi:hypothetical protein
MMVRQLAKLQGGLRPPKPGFSRYLAGKDHPTIM